MTSDQEYHVMTGPRGSAQQMIKSSYADKPATLDAWIVTAPGWHPHWSQYMIAVISLAPIEGQPEAVISRPGATHEVLVVALHPSQTYDVEKIGISQKIRVLTPVNIAEQITATDEIAVSLLSSVVGGVIHGMLNPETSDDPSGVRARWELCVHKTLDHYKDPSHGAAN